MSPAPTATQTTSAGSPTPLGDISGSLLTYALPDEYEQRNSIYDVDGWGSQLVYIELYGEHGGIGQVVRLVDLATGQLKPLNDAQASVGTLFPRISGDDVVWTAGGPTADGALPWRVLRYQISSGETEVIDHGVNSRKEDGSPSAPTIALDAGVVAYTVESATSAWPYGWKIIMRRLSDDTIVREIQTRYSVWDLAIQDGNVLYAEVPPQESGDSAGGLMLSTAAHPEPIQVADNGSGLAIDGQRIVWAGVDNLVLNEPVTGQGVFTATFDDLTPVRLSQPTQGDAGGRYPAAGDGLVVWSEPSPAWDNLYMWDSQTGRTFQIAGQDDTLSHRYSTYLPSIADGWLTWSVTMVTDTQELAQFAGLPIEDLRAAEPAS